MSHRTAKRERRALLNAARNRAESPEAALGSFFGLGGTNGHQGADWSRGRGYVYFPELDTRREISSFTRTEVLRRVRFLYANHGIAKRIVNGLARMVAGTGLTPQAATTDKVWNALAEREFANRTGSQFVFDLGGRYDFPSSQQAQLRFAFRDGDAASVLTESATAQARFAFYEGHQIGNAPSLPIGQDQSLWRDGVRHDAHNRAIAYRLLGDNGSFRDVPAEDVIFFCNYERGGQSRGLSILSQAINHLLDAAEITGYIKQGVKLANQYGYWIETAAGSTGTSATASQRVGGASQTKVQTSAGPVTLERIYGAGAIPDLLPGQSLKFNASSHPHPNNLSLIEFLIRDIAWGVGLSPEILWNIAALGGANTRFVLADAQGWIEEQQAHLVRTYCSRVWLYTIAKAMKTGRLPRCKDPEWWKHVWIPPPRLTVDFGRDGQLHLDQLKMGAITYTRLLGWQGQDFETHTDRWLDEIAYIKAGLNKDNAAARTPDNRNLSWDDIQQFRNVVGFRPVNQVTVGADDMDGRPAAEALAELLKDPAKAQALINQLRRED